MDSSPRLAVARIISSALASRAARAWLSVAEPTRAWTWSTMRPIRRGTTRLARAPATLAITVATSAHGWARASAKIRRNTMEGVAAAVGETSSRKGWAAAPFMMDSDWRRALCKPVFAGDGQPGSIWILSIYTSEYGIVRRRIHPCRASIAAEKPVQRSAISTNSPTPHQRREINQKQFLVLSRHRPAVLTSQHIDFCHSPRNLFCIKIKKGGST